jgi:aspartate carbamoyltransferase catalytic subunit
MPDVQSLIDFSSLTHQKILHLFDQCLGLKRKFAHRQAQVSPHYGVGVLLFFEPSTRTRFSFEAACARAGVHPLILGGASGTSLEKGETMEDTVLNLEAMRPLFFVIRAPDSFDFFSMAEQIGVPVLNAGWGSRAHPTQALLDAVTLFERWQSLEGRRILFVGDIKHSRVVSSHVQLSQILGYRLGYCAPPVLMPDVLPSQAEQFESLAQGLRWADAIVGLRVQKERHASEASATTDFIDDYRRRYGLNQKSLQDFKSNGFILHPGPVNYGVELEPEVLRDRRSVILQLVENGVFLRETLVRNIIGGDQDE